MPSIDPIYLPLLLEAVEELLYKISLRLAELKGQPMTGERRELTQKQRRLEALLHQLTSSDTAAREQEDS